MYTFVARCLLAIVIIFSSSIELEHIGYLIESSYQFEALSVFSNGGSVECMIDVSKKFLIRVCRVALCR